MISHWRHGVGLLNSLLMLKQMEYERVGACVIVQNPWPAYTRYFDIHRVACVTPRTVIISEAAMHFTPTVVIDLFDYDGDADNANFGLHCKLYENFEMFFEPLISIYVYMYKYMKLIFAKRLSWS